MKILTLIDCVYFSNYIFPNFRHYLVEIMKKQTQYQTIAIVRMLRFSFHSETCAKRLEQLELMCDNAPSRERPTTKLQVDMCYSSHTKNRTKA